MEIPRKVEWMMTDYMALRALAAAALLLAAAALQGVMGAIYRLAHHNGRA